MKKLSIIALSAIITITPAFAEVNSTSSLATTAQEVDLSFAFDDVKNLNTSVMTDKEMEETQGAWVTTAFGAAVGCAGYAYGAYKGHHQWNTRKFVGNVASGAVIGTLTGGAGYIASGGAKFIPSLTNAGANIWRVNGFVANRHANYIWRK